MNRSAETVTYTLHPGEVACASRGERLETLLGSCVAIVLTDPRRTVAAMCHIVHAQVAPPTQQASGSYAHVALESMYALLQARGIAPSQCEAYVYGGGNMFPEICRDSPVGEGIARWALAALERDGIPVRVRDLGGNVYRRLAWTVGDGVPQALAVAV